MMAALAGKASYGTVSGSVKVNGKADKLLRYKRVMGFVPQVWPTILCNDDHHASGHHVCDMASGYS